MRRGYLKLGVSDKQTSLSPIGLRERYFMIGASTG